MKLCPCGSSEQYASCCGLYIEAHHLPGNPEQLMRSRYTAFVLKNHTYIQNTMHGKALQAFHEKPETSTITWLALRILNTHQDNPKTGSVEFIATYLKNRKTGAIHEKSDFQCIDGKWFYIDGIHYPVENKSISQNQPCPCGSQKKFKNCHG